MKSDQERELQVKVKLIKLNEVLGEYVNYMYVAHTGDDFHLYFSEIAPPSTSKTSRSGDVVTIESQPKIKLTISPTVISRIIETLQENYGKYKKSVRMQGRSND